MTADILRNVVLWGTGRRAKVAVKQQSGVVPLGGKTGTTNDYKNAAFVGFAPRSNAQGYTLDHAYAVAAYVGYDDNRPMSRGGIRLAGASGALPVWIDTIRGMEEADLLGEAPGNGLSNDTGVWPLRYGPDTLRVAAEPNTGHAQPDLAVEPAAASILVPLPSVEAHIGELIDRPVREAPSTEEALRPTKARQGLWRKRRQQSADLED